MWFCGLKSGSARNTGERLTVIRSGSRSAAVIRGCCSGDRGGERLRVAVVCASVQRFSGFFDICARQDSRLSEVKTQERAEFGSVLELLRETSLATVYLRAVYPKLT